MPAAGRSAAEIRFIEGLAANAWPAAHIETIDGWVLRHTPGVTARRSNSVLALSAGEGPLDDRLAFVEQFYRSRDLPARFQISPLTEPPGLDSVLSDRGYEIEAPVDVQTARVERVLDPSSKRWPIGPRAPVHLMDEPNNAWLTLWTELFRRGDAAVTKERVLARIVPPTAFALLETDGRPAAVGYGVVEAGWLGVFGMGTVAEARGRGLATSILHALARWGSDQSAMNAYLQVEAENAAAHRLYARAGFSTSYGYHYRTREV